jgi:hypothetical protein
MEQVCVFDFVAVSRHQRLLSHLDLRDFLAQCGVRDPVRRATLDSLRKHAFLTYRSRFDYRRFDTRTRTDV